MKRKNTLPLFFTITVVLSLILIIPKLGFIGFVTFNPTNPELNVTYNQTVIIGENFSINLYHVNSNWTNYVTANISINNSNLNLLSTDWRNLSLTPFDNITWNLSAQSLGVTNISIIVNNNTGQFFNTSFIINVQSSGINHSIVTLEVPSYAILNGDTFTINITNNISDWSNFTNATILFNATEINNVSSAFINNPSTDFSVTFQTIDNKITNITLMLADINGNYSYQTKNVTIYNNTCQGTFFQCGGSFFRDGKNFTDCYYDYLLSKKSFHIYFSTGTIRNVSFDFEKIAFNDTSYFLSDRVYIYNVYNFSSNEKYNLTGIVTYTDDHVCKHTESLDLFDIVQDVNLTPVFDINGTECENLIGIKFTDMNLSDGNFTNLNNITITDFGGLYNNTNNFQNIGSNNSVSYDNLTCSIPQNFELNVSFDNSINRNYYLDLWVPSCDYLQNVSFVSDILTLTNTNPYVNHTPFFDELIYWYKIDNFSLFLTSEGKKSKEKNLIFNKSFITYNETDYDIQELSILNNKSREYNYTLNINFSSPSYSCIYDFNYSKNETADPNITIDYTITGPTSSGLQPCINEVQTFDFTFTNYENTSVNFSTKLMIGGLPLPNCNISLFVFNETQNRTNLVCVYTPSASNILISHDSNYTKHEDNSTYTNSDLDFWVEDLNETINFVDCTAGSGGNDGDDDGSDSFNPIRIITGETNEENSENESEPQEEQPETIEEREDVLEEEDKGDGSDNKKISLLLNNLTHFRAYVYRYGKTEVRDHVKNPSILTQYDVFAKVTIPKNIVLTTDEITGNFTVLEYDPKILFYYEKILSGQDILLNYTINKELTESEINQIIIEVNSSFSQKDIEELEQKANQTSKNIDIKIDVKKTADNKTKITAILDPDKDLGKTRIYMKIPKCLAEHLSEIEFERDDYTVIEDDPLIAWSFDEITTQQSLEFEVLKEVDQDCWEQIIVLPIADEIKGALTKQTDWYYKFWPVLFIIFIMIIAPFISKHSHILKKDKHYGKHALHNDILQELELGFEELALSLIIILNILDFFEVLPPDLDFVKKVISWTFLGYLLYQVNITNILFGIKNNYQDFLLIFGYFGLMLSDIFNTFTVMFIEITDSGAQTFILPFLNFILPFSNEIITIGFYMGVGIILLLTILDFSKEIKAPSTMAAIHEEGKPSSLYKYVERFFLVLFAYFVFFVIFFKFFMEWFAISVDAVIAVVGIVVYFLMFFKKHHKHYREEHFVFKVGTIGEEFYQKFLGFFADRKMIVFGLTGMLVLHLLVDLSSFVIPYIIGLHDSLYFLQLSTGDVLLNHTPVVPLLKSIWTASWALNLKIIAVYVLEFFAVIMFLVLPAIIWYDLETGHKVTPHWLLNGAFISGLVMFFQVPLFRLEPILGKEIVGIDLLLLNIFDIIQSFDTALYVAIGIGWMVLLLSFSKRLNKLFLILGVAFSQVFFLGYVYSYIVSWSDFFTNAIPAMFTAKKYLIGGVFALFFGIIVMFYVMGFVAYLIIVVDRWGKTKIKEHDKNAKAMEVLVPYIEKIGDLSLARHQLEDKGWPKEIVHEAVIRAIQVEEKIKRFFIFEKRKKINKEIAKHELISHGWSELAANNLIRRYW